MEAERQVAAGVAARGEWHDHWAPEKDMKEAVKTSEVFRDSLLRMACVLFWKQADGSADLPESRLVLHPYTRPRGAEALDRMSGLPAFPSGPIG